MDRWDGPGVIRESGMIAKEQGHRVMTTGEHGLWRDEVEKGGHWGGVQWESGERKTESIHGLGFEPAGFANGWSVQPGREG